MARASKKNFFSRFTHRKLPAWIRNKYVFASAAFLLWMLFFDHNDLISQVQLRMKLSDYRQKASYYQQQITEVKSEKQELLTNRDSLERFARERYMMKKPDEDLFIIVPPAKQ